MVSVLPELIGGEHGAKSFQISVHTGSWSLCVHPRHDPSDSRHYFLSPDSLHDGSHPGWEST